MKKRIFAALCAASMLMSAGCGSKSSVIPDNGTIESNLRENKYTVSTSTQDMDGTMISAISGSENLTFLRLNSSEECNRLYDVVVNANPNAEVTYKYADDAEFGNVIICGTKDAVKAAGITIVKVKE